MESHVCVKQWGRGKAPLVVVPGDRRLHSLTLASKVNAPPKPKWGKEGGGGGGGSGGFK